MSPLGPKYASAIQHEIQPRQASVSWRCHRPATSLREEWTKKKFKSILPFTAGILVFFLSSESSDYPARQCWENLHVIKILLGSREVPCRLAYPRFLSRQTAFVPHLPDYTTESTYEMNTQSALVNTLLNILVRAHFIRCLLFELTLGMMSQFSLFPPVLPRYQWLCPT